MKHLYLFLLALPAFATDYEFRIVAQPGTGIGETVFPDHTTIDSVSLNDSGEYAFIAHWISYGEEHAGVFTSKRIVAQTGDTIDGHYIAFIASGARVQINNRGQVAMELQYSASADDARVGFAEDGVFLDGHLVGSRRWSRAEEFRLNNDGSVLIGKVEIPAAVPLKPLPDPLVSAAAALAWNTYGASMGNMIPSSVNGNEILLPINFEKGFLLLLGTPKEEHVR